jgi:hypothetical protein
MKQSDLLGVSCAFILIFLQSSSAYAAVISGAITDWVESGPVQTIGDGINHVTLGWSYATPDRGYFYGSSWTGDSDVAYAAGVTDITQITDASLYSFTNASIGPYCDADCDPDGVGEFIVWRNISSGYYGVLRLDDMYPDPVDPIYYNTLLSGTWWFQTDGTADFSSSIPPIPIPPALWLFGSGLLGLVGVARKKRGEIK